MKTFELDTEVEATIGGQDVELSVMEAIETEHGTFFTGYNHTSHQGFIQMVTAQEDDGSVPQVPELVGANFSAARRNITPEVAARVMEESDFGRVEFSGDVDRHRLVKDIIGGFNMSRKGDEALSHALLSQYEQIPAEQHIGIVQAKTAGEILATLDKEFPDGPKTAAELKGSSRPSNPFEHTLGVIDMNRGTVDSALVASLDN